MNIEQLQYMCAISQHKSITKAAESLYVTQQTVSKAIHRLEKELGFQLLVRNYNGIILLLSIAPVISSIEWRRRCLPIFPSIIPR